MSTVLVLPEGQLDGIYRPGVVSGYHVDVAVANQEDEGAGAVHGAKKEELNRAGHSGNKGTAACV